MSETKQILEILVVNHKEGEESAHLFDPTEITIGRKGDNTLVLPSGSVSSHHARIFLKEGKLYVEDLGSTNGTLLKKKRLKGIHALWPGDEIQIAQFTLFIRRLRSGGIEEGAAP
ncbi:MAG: FHA domain-containing protein, partial [Deltaproteobacteria bacterium]